MWVGLSYTCSRMSVSFKRSYQRFFSISRRITSVQKRLNSNSSVKDVEIEDDIVTSDTKVINQSISTINKERVLKAVIIGAPNAGKSMLVNQLIGQKVLSVSPKVHTTQQKALGIFTEGYNQVILLDTPGIIPYQYGRRLRLSKSFLTGPQRATEEAHLILVVVDTSNKRTRETLDPGVVQILQTYPRLPAVLVLNKIDLLRYKHILLDITQSLSDLKRSNTFIDNDLLKSMPQETHESSDSHILDKEEKVFQEVFMISALSGDGVNELRTYLLASTYPSSWEYTNHEITDQPPEVIAKETVREKLFLYLHKELPYITKQSVAVWEQKDNTLIVLMNLTCKKSSQASIVIGPGGTTIRAITAEAKKDLEAIFHCPVELTLNVRSD